MDVPGGDVGVMPPPPGVTPDFHGSSQLQHTLIIVYSITFALATVVLTLRLYTGLVLVGKLGLDAFLIVLAWAVSLAFFITTLLVMPSGFGKHLWDVTGTQLQGYLKLLLVLAITYIWPPTLTKLAILVLYHRIDPGLAFRICIYFVAFTLIASTVVFTVLFCGPCNPLTTGSGMCLNNIAIAQAVLNIVTDGFIIILPIPTIRKLHMPFKQKVTVAAILALGSGVVIASCVRVAYVRAMQNNPDVTWTQASAAVWSCVELNIGILCNCLAMLRPFVRRHMVWLASIVGGGGSSGGVGSAGYSKKGLSSGGGNKSAFGSPWRGDADGHGYQLHSVGRTKMVPGEEEGGMGAGKGIVVVDEFHVQYGSKRENSDGSSTENILDDERPQPRRAR